MFPTAYVICATPRSGSTLLCDLLAAAGCGRPHSYFRGDDIGYWAGEWSLRPAADDADPTFNPAYLTAMSRAGRGCSDLFGLRLMWDSVGEATRRFDAAFGGHAPLPARMQQAWGPTLFVHLSRLNKDAQAVSLVRAQQSGLWHLHADGSERERSAPAVTPTFDCGRLGQARDELRTHDAAWSNFFDEHGIAPVRLTYEAVAADARSVLAELLAALGRDPAIASGIEAKTARLADGVSADWLKRLA